MGTDNKPGNSPDTVKSPKLAFTERQHRLLKWNYLQCLLEARRPPPADAQEYLFAADEEDPTYYYEEEDDDDH
ncbi:hypothetical protein DdX_08341 [Ditylenchus destructor]|uniref:Uncharacterized protein n=1 Tax=Ditylenchus destructor TaxID=166010 RepID=A0AAD4R7H0_9BILA|nr:hypothetical protein DdX_08341 [Ditylenchus destructor]